VKGFLAGDVLMTNGPFVTVHVDGGGNSAGVGQTLSADGEVTVKVEVRHAPWVVPDRITAYFNGEVIATSAGEANTTGVITFEVPFTPTTDGFVVVEVAGQQNMFPAAFPSEIPPQQFSDVLDAVGGSFGLGSGDGLKPELIYPVRPYALTNPVWIDRDGDGEIAPVRELPPLARMTTTPGVVDVPGATEVVTTPLPDGRTVWQRYMDNLPARKRRWLEQRLPMWLWPTDHPADARRVLVQFMRHAH